MSKPKASIWDMDGTLCDVTSIRHHVLNKRKNFTAFAYLSSHCPPNEWVADMLKRAMAAGETIIIVTARSDEWFDLTVNWLYANNIPFDDIYMRKQGDTRKDYIIKEEILEVLQETYEIVYAVDDNPSVIALWEEHNIPTIIVPGWAEGEAEEAVESKTL